MDLTLFVDPTIFDCGAPPYCASKKRENLIKQENNQAAGVFSKPRGMWSPMWDRPRPLFQGDQFLTSVLYEFDDLHTYKGKVSSQKSDLPCCQKPLQELYHLEVIRILPLAYD